MSLATVRIRPARFEDLNAIVELERSVTEAPHWSEKEYRAALEVAEGAGLRRHLLVAENDGDLVGFAVAKVIGLGEVAQAELESVAVVGKARRGGVGKALCEAIFAWCRQEGAREVELEVRAANNAAVALYERIGFKQVGKRRAYYREPVDDAVLMRLELRDRSVY